MTRNRDRRPRVLLLCTTTGYQTQAFVKASRKLDLEMVFGTDRCKVLEDPWRDGAIALRFGDPEGSAQALVEYARRRPLDAIVSIGDRPTVTASLAATALGLPCHPAQAAAASHNKLLTRQALSRAGMRVPSFACYRKDADADVLAGQASYPCVLKPLALSASRGVMRADKPEEFATAFRRIANLLSSPEVQVLREEAADFILVESYIEGGEVALEGILTHGRLKVLAIFDKPDPLCGPFFEETIYVTPSTQDRLLQEDLASEVQKACRALGLNHGPVHAELRLNSLGPWVLEVAGRPIGGLCSRALRFKGSLSLEELILQHALGEDVESIDREELASGVMMIPIPAEGIYKGVEGVKEARSIEGVKEILITAKEEQRLVPLPEGASYLGFIFARGRSPKGVEHSLRAAHSRLRFEIYQVLPVTR